MTFWCAHCSRDMNLKHETLLCAQVATGVKELGEFWRLLVECAECGEHHVLECDAGTGYRVRTWLRLRVVKAESEQRQFDNEFSKIVKGLFDV